MNANGIIALSSLALCFVVFLWKIGKDNDAKIRRNYKRLDEVKENIKNEFINKDICSERQQRVFDKIDRVERDVVEIKIDVKKLLSKNGLK